MRVVERGGVDALAGIAVDFIVWSSGSQRKPTVQHLVVREA
jgi:hypothetical protein